VAEQKKTYSRVGTARALVLLASGLAVGGAALFCLFTFILANRIALPTIAFGALVLVSAILAVVLAIRARSLRAVVGLGCGTLLAGVVVGLAVMLLLISRFTGNPT
jgi:hypothetical protein